MDPNRELNPSLKGATKKLVETADHWPLMAVTDPYPCEHETFQAQP